MDALFKENTKLVFTFRLTLNQETDRGCALMAAAFLENELVRVMREKMVGSRSHLNELFEFNGPLGTFSSKVKLAYSMGVINKQTFSDLELIRKIRNEFGHNHELIDFNTEMIKNRIDNLSLHSFEKGTVLPRKIFTNAVLGNLALIHGSLFRGDKFIEPKKVEYTDEMKKRVREGDEDLLRSFIKIIQEVYPQHEDTKKK